MVLRTDSGVLTMSATRLLCGLNISRQQLRFPAHLFYRLSTVFPLIALRQRATMLIDKTRVDSLQMTPPVHRFVRHTDACGSRAN